MSPASCAPTSTGSTPTRERLAAIEERLDAVDRLTRKHGGDVASVIAHAEHCRSEIDRLEFSEVQTAEAARP